MRGAARGRVRRRTGFYVGVPVQIGAGGVEKVIEVALTPDEQKALDESVSHVRELVEASEKFLNA